MSLLSQPVRIVILVLIAISTVLFLRIQTLQEHSKRLKQTYAQARSAADQRQQVIDKLQQQIMVLDEQQRQSADAQAEIERLANNRLAALRKLEDESTTLRRWAADSVPVEFGRLRDRDALIGAGAYHERLRDAKGMHAARQPTTHQR